MPAMMATKAVAQNDRADGRPNFLVTGATTRAMMAMIGKLIYIE